MEPNELITQLYVGYYNRAPDPEGLDYWMGRLAAGVSLADIAESFATSPEAISTYPWLAVEEPTEGQVGAFLEAIYQNMFNRSIDADGLAYYSNQLLTGERTAGEIIASIQANANTNTNNTDGQILANKVEVGLAWATAAEAQPGFEYNAEAAASANTILDGVNASQASVDAALAVVEDFFDAPASLVAGLEELAAAEAALDAANEAAALADDDLPADETSPAYQSFIDNYDLAEATTERGEALTARNSAQSDLLTAQQALADARVLDSDAELAQNLADELAAVADNDAAQAILENRAEANAALEADVAADGSNVELLSELRSAIGNYVAAGGDLDESVDDGVDPADASDDVTVGDLLTALNAALTFADPEAPTTGELAAVDTLLGTVGDYTGFSATAGVASEVALDAALDAVAQRDTLTEEVASAEAAFAGSADLDAVEAAEGAIEDRDALIQDVADAETALEEAQDYLDQFVGLVDAIEAATADVTEANAGLVELGYVAPVEVVTAGVTATADSDIFLAGDDSGTITGFALAGDDVLYVGSGFSLVTLDDENVGNDAVGSAAALEVFLQQQGADTVIYVETAAFDGSATDGTFDGVEITLSGVNAEDVVYNNGFFSVGSAVA